MNRWIFVTNTKEFTIPVGAIWMFDDTESKMRHFYLTKSFNLGFKSWNGFFIRMMTYRMISSFIAH